MLMSKESMNLLEHARAVRGMWKEAASAVAHCCFLLGYALALRRTNRPPKGDRSEGF